MFGIISNNKDKTPDYSFQTELKNQVLDILNTDKQCILSACTGGGKTNMAIDLLNNYLDKAIIVKTSRTIEIRDNFSERIQSKEINCNIRILDSSSKIPKTFKSNTVYIVLPQTLIKCKQFNNIGLVIVDEATNGTVGKGSRQSQAIFKAIKKNSPNYHLLLLDAQAIKLKESKEFGHVKEVHFPLEEGLKRNILINGCIKIIPTRRNIFNMSDFDSEGNVSVTKLNANLKDQAAELEIILEAIFNKHFNRISIAGLDKQNYFKLKNPFAKYFEKCLIYCRSIKQANLVYELLQNKGLRVAIDHSKSDGNEAKSFKTNNMNFLVVVNKCRAGFDLPVLADIVDLSNSLNILIDHQKNGRMLRAAPGKKMPNYYKVCDSGLLELTEVIVSTATALGNKKFYEEFSLKDFKNIKIPTPSTTKERLRLEKENKTKGENDKSKQKSNSIKSVEFTVEGKLNEVNQIRYSEGIDGEISGYITIGEVLESLSKNSPIKNKKQIIEFIKKYNRRPSQCSKAVAEKKLGQALSSYISQSSDCFDAGFKAEVEALCPIIDTVSIKKHQIIEFIETHKRRPNQHSKDLNEKKLGNALSSYTRQTHASFDDEFKAKVDTLCPIINMVSIKKQQIIEFIKANKGKPSTVSKNATEKKLGIALYRYTYQSSSCFDNEFKARITQLLEDLKI